MERGKLLVIEGTDKSGKKTQTDLLLKKLNRYGLKAVYSDFPRYDTLSGRIVGQVYLGKDRWGEDKGWFGNADKVDPKVASLYYAADRRFNLPEIQKLLEENDFLLLDRYVSSNMGHQGGKIRDSKKREQFYGWLDSLEYGLLELPKPDLTLLLLMPWQVGQELAKGMSEKVDEHEKNPEHLKNAQEAYLHLAQKYNWPQINCTEKGTLDSIKTREKISEEIWQAVISVFPETFHMK